MSFGPGLLSSLFGNDQKKLRDQLSKLSSSANVGKVTNQFYNQNLASPAYSQAQGNIAAGANATGGQLASSLGARGIGTSGSAAVMSSLIPSIVGQQQAGLRTSAFGNAQSQAQEQIQRQMAALTGTQGPSGTRQLFAGGLESIGPLLQQWLQSMGQRGGSYGPTMGQPGFTYPQATPYGR